VTFPCQNYLLFALGRGQLFVGQARKGKKGNGTGNWVDAGQPFQIGNNKMCGILLGAKMG